MTDYSDLIIVNYEWGFGGDFFSSLLYKHYYPDYKLRYHKHNNGHLNNHIDFPMHLNHVKSVWHLLYCISSKWDGTFHEKKLDEKFYHLQNAFKIVYDDNYDHEFGRSCYELSKPKVMSIHYDSNPKHFEKFELDMVYPKSKKFRLVTHDLKYKILFCIIGVFKIESVIFDQSKVVGRVKGIDAPGSPRIFSKDFEQYQTEYTPFQDFVDIDVGKLYFGSDDYIPLVEQQVSDTIGTNITLNREWLSTYKHKNKMIVEHMLGHELDADDVDNNLLDFKNYFIKNNKYHVIDENTK